MVTDQSDARQQLVELLNAIGALYIVQGGVDDDPARNRYLQGFGDAHRRLAQQLLDADDNAMIDGYAAGVCEAYGQAATEQLAGRGPDEDPGWTSQVNGLIAGFESLQSTFDTGTLDVEMWNVVGGVDKPSVLASLAETRDSLALWAREAGVVADPPAGKRRRLWARRGE